MHCWSDSQVREAGPPEHHRVERAERGDVQRRRFRLHRDQIGEVLVSAGEDLDRAAGRCVAGHRPGKGGRGFEGHDLMAAVSEGERLAAAAGGADEDARRRRGKVAADDTFLPGEQAGADPVAGRLVGALTAVADLVVGVVESRRGMGQDQAGPGADEPAIGTIEEVGATQRASEPARSQRRRHASAVSPLAARSTCATSSGRPDKPGR